MKLRHPISGVSRYRCRPSVVLSTLEAVGICLGAFLITAGLVRMFWP